MVNSNNYRGKKMIKKIGILLISLMMIVGCATSQRIDDLEKRAAALEEGRVMEMAAGVGWVLCCR
jgi:uncharacterized lipoprotein YajG